MGEIPRRYSYEYHFTVRRRYGKVGFGPSCNTWRRREDSRDDQEDEKKKSRRIAACSAWKLAISICRRRQYRIATAAIAF